MRATAVAASVDGRLGVGHVLVVDRVGPRGGAAEHPGGQREGSDDRGATRPAHALLPSPVDADATGFVHRSEHQ